MRSNRDGDTAPHKEHRCSEVEMNFSANHLNCAGATLFVICNQFPQPIEGIVYGLHATTEVLGYSFVDEQLVAEEVSPVDHSRPEKVKHC